MPDYQYALGIYSRFFDRHGYDFEMVSAGPAEIVRLLSSGEVDGDCARAESFGERMGSLPLIKTEEPLRQAYIGAWTTKQKWRPDLLNVEHRSTLRFGFVRGIIFLQQLTSSMGFDQVVELDSTEQGVEQLKAGKIDVWLDYEAVFGGVRSQSLDHDIRLVGALASLPVYPYLLQQHRELVPLLSDEIAMLARQEPYQHHRKKVGDEGGGRGRPIVFVCSLAREVPVYDQIYSNYSQAFAALGYRFEMIHLPILRAEAELLSNRVDGSCGRAADFFKIWPEIVKVAEPVMPVTIQAWSRNVSLQVGGRDSFRGKGYRVGVVRGTHTIKHLLMQYGQKHLIHVTSPIIGMKMLAAGRLDIFVDSATSVRSVVQRMGINQPLYMVGNLHHLDVYPALRPGLEALAQPLARELKSLNAF
ncbi:MAG: hypothetical protein AseanaTS_30340 [Candidatus Pelagadaptatus aseana]|uniref:hypothetical protein n=1 Tax=Candidatus Pelagadaptatus aseana TaxID=3120508 RepID=UPI0039B2F606